MSKEKSFYNYVLFRPWNGTPCYVGKGSGNRWRQHLLPGAKRKNPGLAIVFEEAKRLRLEVIAVVINSGLTEKQAFECEIALIAAIGTEITKTGPLVNRSAGGDGIVMSREQIIERNKATSAGRMRQPPEVRQAWAAKRLITMTSERRSEIARNRAAGDSPEFRKRFAKAGSLAATAMKVWVNDGLSNKRIAYGARCPDGWVHGRLKENPKAFLEAACNTKWITDGQTTRRLRSGESVPHGWKFGRKSSPPKRLRPYIKKGSLNHQPRIPGLE